MNTKIRNLIIVYVIWVSITFVSCFTNNNVRLLESVFGGAKTNWFIQSKIFNTNVTVSDVRKGQDISPYFSEDLFLNTTELVTKYGYEVREHYITTHDCYILSLIQIVGKGPVVFLMHGFLGSSDDYVVSGPGKALAYLLADAGYNVWLGNARGNKYSRNHKFLNPEMKPFWKFSWHQIGVIDLPTMIDHALLVSGTHHLTYIGHSQGTTVFFVLNSEKPEYNKKFNLMISLGTMAWTWHIKAPAFQRLVSIPDTQFELLENLGIYEIFPASPVNEFIHAKLCCSTKLALLTCLTALFEIGGFDYDQIDFDNACVKLAHIPSGASMRQLRHFAQLARSRGFAQFDFGKKKNLATYGSKTPPPYKVEAITAPVVIFYGDNDWLSSFDDTLILTQRLPNVLSVNRIPYSSFNHYDFIWATDAYVLLYREILKIIAKTFQEGKI